jgi:hypothetical protein
LLTLKDNGEEFRFGIDMTLHAPVLKIISVIHDDSYLGNSNFLPDPGETLHLKVRVRNEGSSAASGTVTVTPAGTWLTLKEPKVTTGVLMPGEEKDLLLESDDLTPFRIRKGDPV